MKAQELSSGVVWDATDPAVRYAAISDHLTDEWAAEPKIDGWRGQLAIGTERSWVSTDQSSFSANLPHLAKNLASADLDGTILDGELTWNGGMPGSVLASTEHNAVRKQRWYKHDDGRKGEWVVFHAFDVLAVMGTDVSDLPYDERRPMLEMAVQVLGSSHVRLVDQYPATPAAIDQALDAGYEGVMLKKKDSRVHPDVRSAKWQKVKRTATADLFIIGSKAGTTREVGSLVVAYWDGDKPVEVGHVGSGLSYRDRAILSDPDNPGHVHPDYLGTVIEVGAQEVTRNGRLRHTRFMGYRTDKTYTDCGPEQMSVFHTMSGKGNAA